MSNQSDTDKLAYVLTVLKHTEMSQPKYHDIAAETGMPNANKAQVRFKAIIEGAGFRLVNRQVRGLDDDSTPAASATPLRAKATKPKKKAKTNGDDTPTSSVKKRKIVEMEGHESNGDDGVIQGSAGHDEDQD